MKRSPLSRRTPLRPRSKKRQAAMPSRRALVARLIEDRPYCERCRVERSVDAHELKRRSQGGDFLDPDQIVVLCRRCHDWVGAYPVQAHAEGWHVWSYEPVQRRSQGGSA